MAKRMSALAKHRAERELQRLRCEEAALRFLARIEEYDASLEPVAVEVSIPKGVPERSFHTWWPRDEVKAQEAAVIDGMKDDYLPHFTFHGGRSAAPGEAHTIRLWLEAAEIGRTALAAAILLTTLRSLNRPYELSPAAARKQRDDLFSWSYDFLKENGLDPYCRSTVWFLPCQFTLRGHAETMEELANLLATQMGLFLQEWAPVRVLVGDPNLTIPLSPAHRTGT